MHVQLEDGALIAVWLTTWYMPWVVFASIWPLRRNPALRHAPPMRFVVPGCVCLLGAFVRPLLLLWTVSHWLRLVWVVGMVATSAWVLVLEGQFIVHVHATALLASYAKWNQDHIRKMQRYRWCLRPSAQRALLIALWAFSVATSVGLFAIIEPFVSTSAYGFPSPPSTARMATLATTWSWLILTAVSSALLRRYRTVDYFDLFRSLLARTYSTLVLLFLQVAAAHWISPTDAATQAFHLVSVVDTLVAQTNALFLLRATTCMIRYGTTSRQLRAALTSRAPPSLPTKPTRQQSKSIEVLAAFLDSADGFHAFHAYCLLELRLEDVLAFRLCREFHHGQTHSLFAAQHVYQQCVSADGPLATPAAAAWRGALRCKLHKVAPFEVGPTLFDPLAHDLLHGLYTQVFPRFCRHPFGRSWKWFALRNGQGKTKTKTTRADDRMKASSTYLVRGSIDESNEPTSTGSGRST